MTRIFPFLQVIIPAPRWVANGLVLSLLVAGTGCTTTPVVQSEEDNIHHQAMTAMAALEQDLPNTELTPEIFYNIILGEIAGQRGNLQVAVASLAKAARESRDPRLAARASQAALYARLYTEALENAELWVEIQPENLEARETLATVFLDSGDPVNAQLHLEKALEIAKRTNVLDQMFLRIAGILGRQRDHTTAFEIMESLTVQFKDNPHASLALAHLGVRAGDLDKALLGINQCLKVRPNWDEAALYKGRILISRKELAQAEAFYLDYLGDNPDATKVRLNFARLLIDRKQWARAHKEFVRVVADAPDDAESIFAVGLLSYQAQRYDEAQKYLKRHLELQPDNDQARLYLGQIAEELKDYPQASKWYESISSPNYFFEAQTRLGINLYHMGDLQAAREHLQSVPTVNDKQKVQLILAEEQILREAKQYHNALKVLNVAMAELPEQNDVRYARALIAEKLHMIDLSISDLRAILKKEPNNAHALNALGYTLADRTNNLEEAERLISLALKQKPNDPFVLDSMGWVQYRLGNHARAIKLLKQALALRNDAEISAHLGEVLWVSGDKSTARSVWENALQTTPDNESLLGIIKKYTDLK